MVFRLATEQEDMFSVHKLKLCDFSREIKERADLVTWTSSYGLVFYLYDAGSFIEEGMKRCIADFLHRSRRLLIECRLQLVDSLVVAFLTTESLHELQGCSHVGERRDL